MPKPARLVILALSLLTFLSTFECARLALSRADGTAWGTLGFEIVIAAACIIGFLLGRGRFGAGPGIAAACVAGSIFVGTLFGRLEFVTSPRAILNDPWFLARTAIASIIALAAAYTVLSRDRRSIPYLIRSAILLVPLAIFGAFWLKTGGLWLGTSQSGGTEVVRISLLFLIAIFFGGLFCTGLHTLIRAFEQGVPPGQPGAPPPILPPSGRPTNPSSPSTPSPTST